MMSTTNIQKLLMNTKTKKMSRKFESSSKEELLNYLNQSNEALRMENARLMDLNERLTMCIEVRDAEVVSNGMTGYYNFINNFNYTLKTK